MSTTEEELRRRRLAEQTEQLEFPANSAAGFTPPAPPRKIDPNLPVDQQGGAFGAGQATREFVGDVGKGIASGAETAMLTRGSEAELQREGFRRMGRGVNNFVRGVFGGDPLPDVEAPPMPFTNALTEKFPARGGGGRELTGTQPVPTQNEAPVADAQGAVENQFPDVIDSQAALPGAVRLSPDSVDVTDVRRSDFTDPSQIPGDIERQVLNEQAPTETQATESAEPGQQSIVEAPPTPDFNRVRVIRGTRQTDAIVDNPELAGLEGPIGLDDADLVKFGRLREQGLSGADSQNLLLRQKQVQAELVRAGAQAQNAATNAVSFVDRQDPETGEFRRMFYQIQPDGEISFLDTDIAARFEPKLGNRVTRNALGESESTPIVVIPSTSPDGQPDSDVNEAWDLTQWGSEDRDDQRAQEIMKFIELARGRQMGNQEIQDALDAEFGN